MVLSQAGNFVTAMTGFIDPKTASMISALLAFGYGLARGMAKSGTAPTNDKPQ